MLQDSNELMTLDADSQGKIYPKCQSTDYMLQGESLSHCNIMEYFVDTYEANMEQHYMPCADGKDDDMDDTTD